LERAKKVIAVEYDARMAAEVTKRVQGTSEQKKLKVILGDAGDDNGMYVDAGDTPHFFKEVRDSAADQNKEQAEEDKGG
jgi:ATP phosphoribosyltransferase regulatory subunit HisZ